MADARGVNEVEHRRKGADAEPAAATRHQRMHIGDCLAAIELLQHRLIGRIAEPLVAVIGLQVDAVGVQRIEDVFDLFQGGVDVHHRQRRE